MICAGSIELDEGTNEFELRMCHIDVHQHLKSNSDECNNTYSVAVENDSFHLGL